MRIQLNFALGRDAVLYYRGIYKAISCCDKSIPVFLDSLADIFTLNCFKSDVVVCFQPLNISSMFKLVHHSQSTQKLLASFALKGIVHGKHIL